MTSAPPIASRVLVTGATGFTGSVLTRKLAEAGLDVRAIARTSSDTSHLADLDIAWFRGDVFDPDTVRDAMEGVEVVFHLATAYREGKRTAGYFDKVHVESTRLLAEQARRIEGFSRFVHVSTIGVHGHIEGDPANEEHPFAPGDPYQRTKAEAELWIRDYAGKNALPLTVIRPAGIFGPGDKRLFKVFRMATRPFFPILGYGECLYHLIHVDDLSDAMIVAATHPAAEGEVFICGNTEAIPLPDMAGIIARELGRRLRVVRIPVTPFFIAAALCELVCRPLGIEPPLYRRRVAFFTKDRSFDTSKLRNVLGFVPKYDNESGLIQATQWYVRNGWLRKGQTHER